MDDYINNQVIELNEIIEENENRATRRVKTETHHSGPEDSGRRLYRMVAVGFGMLCVVQVSLNISLRLVYNRNIGDSMKLYKTNVTKERDQLQTSYNRLTKERDQLQRERDNYQKKFEEQTCCSNGWMGFEHSCYYIVTEKNTWDYAREDCLRRGANLVIIDSKEEQTLINRLKTVSHVWIGLTDSVTEGTWKWVDGTPLTTPSYWSGEPDGGGVENCVVVPYSSSGQGEWWDYGCSNREYWICEKGSL